ncbi:MAG: acyltransferase [Rhodobacteraceae bacterium]|nr:acyltransferase [Paracoccaceae bacterium]
MTFANVSVGRENNFNLIRMAAASGVLVSHAYPLSLGPDATQPLQVWLDGTTLGSVCVIVFFAVSGFFITKSFDRSGDWRRFVKARAYRLFPALIFVLCLTVLVAGTMVTTADPAPFWVAAFVYLLRNATLAAPLYDLPGVFTANPYGPAINGSLWTLFYEVLCYLAVFLIGIAGRLRPNASLGAFLAVLMVLSVADAVTTLSGRLSNLIDLALPFAIGAAIYLLRDRIPFTPLIALALATAAALGHGTAAFPLLLRLALSYTALWIGFVRWRPALAYNRLGDYSYGTYIFAFPIQQLLASNGITSPALNMTLALPATYACAVVSWHLIEAPALARVRHVT